MIKVLLHFLVVLASSSFVHGEGWRLTKDEKRNGGVVAHLLYDGGSSLLEFKNDHGDARFLIIFKGFPENIKKLESEDWTEEEWVREYKDLYGTLFWGFDNYTKNQPLHSEDEIVKVLKAVIIDWFNQFPDRKDDEEVAEFLKALEDLSPNRR